MEIDNYKDGLEEYDFSIIPLLKEGFKRSDGVKLKFLGAVIIFIVISLITNSILNFIFPSAESFANSYIKTLISAPITIPITIGITMLGVTTAREKNIEVPDIFNYYNLMFTIIVTYLTMTALITIGLIFLVLPGIYLTISYLFSYQLVVDKGMGTWEAMELSRKTVTKQWFKFFGLALVTGVVILVSALPLGIGLIWTIPMTYISYGLLYHHLFDDEEV